MLITMTVLVVLAAVALAIPTGYYCGRRAACAPPSWKQRTSRVALGKRTLHLIVLLAARRVRRRLRTERTVEVLGMRVLAPLWALCQR